MGEPLTRTTAAWFREGQIRITIRAAFSVFLLVAVLLPYLSILQQKRLSDTEHANSRETAEQRFVDRLLSPSGQLALQNPSRILLPATPLRPMILPFAEIQADTPGVVLDQVRAIGCPIQFKSAQDALIDQGSICVGLRKGDAQEIRSRLLITGTFFSTRLIPHIFVEAKAPDAGRPVALRFQDAHRIRVTLHNGNESPQWVLPVQIPIDRKTHRVREGLTLTAYRLDARGVPITWKPDFTSAWVMEGECVNMDEPVSTCIREHTFSIAIPRDRWLSSDSSGPSPDKLTLDVVVNGPNASGKAVTILDTSGTHTAVVPFGRSDIDSYLTSGESMTVTKHTKGASQELFTMSHLQGKLSLQTFGERVLRFVGINLIGVNSDSEERRSFKIRGDSFELIHKGSMRGFDPELLQRGAAVAAYAALMIAMTAAAWLTIEVSVMKRVQHLTSRARLVSHAMRSDENLKRFDFSDLKGHDELGVLATGLDDLLKRVADDVQRNTIRINQERSVLRAIGHEIRGPLQSLSAVLADSEPGSGYVLRMLKAVGALYGSASPSDGFQNVELDSERMDLAAFLDSAARNAHHAGIDNVIFRGPTTGIDIRADQSALEDAVLHILQNAVRYRSDGSPIIINLVLNASTASVTIHNNGPHIPEHLLDRIFEYGVSERLHTTDGSYGQGLFVSATYLSKMGGTIFANNVFDGVDFVIELPVIKD